MEVIFKGRYGNKNYLAHHIFFKYIGKIKKIIKRFYLF